MDLPEVISLREEWLGKEERDVAVPASLFEKEWLSRLKESSQGKAVCFVASGLFYYFKKAQAVALLKSFCTIPNAQLIFDTVNSAGMKRMTGYMKQLRHEEAKMYFCVDNAEALAEEISAQTVVVEERDFFMT